MRRFLSKNAREVKRKMLFSVKKRRHGRRGGESGRKNARLRRPGKAERLPPERQPFGFSEDMALPVGIYSASFLPIMPRTTQIAMKPAQIRTTFNPMSIRTPCRLSGNAGALRQGGA